MIEYQIEELLGAAPDFAPRYLELVEEADADPGMAVTLTELADYVAGLARQMDEPLPALRRCLDAVEALARRGEDEAELVAWAFLDSLDPDERRRLAGWLGPRTRSLLAEVDGSDGPAVGPPGRTPPARPHDSGASTAAPKASGASSIG